MNLGDFFQDLARKVPGQSWLSSTRLGDIIGGGSWRALERNKWSAPWGADTSSFDDLFGAGASSSHGLRNTARGVGALFGGGALWKALAGVGAAAGEAGGGGAGGMGSQGLEGGGTTIFPGEGTTEAGTPWWDYARQYGRQGANLLSNSMNNMPGGQPMPYPEDNSMILPQPQQPSFSDLPPGLMTMLLAQAFQQQQQPQPEPEPAIRSGGVI